MILCLVIGLVWVVVVVGSFICILRGSLILPKVYPDVTMLKFISASPGLFQVEAVL